MSSQPGWISLLASIGERFEALSSGDTRITVYFVPFGNERQFLRQISPPNRDPLWQRMGEGTLPAGSLYPDRSYYYLLANPHAPDAIFRNQQVVYSQNLSKLAEEAWTILPGEVRRSAVGADGLQGWMIVVFRVFINCGIGAAHWSDEASWIEGDFAKASALAIRAFGQHGLYAVMPELPRNAAALCSWLEPRIASLRRWLDDHTTPFDLAYVHEINDRFGPPTYSVSADLVQWWAISVQPMYAEWLIETAHRLLTEWGFRDLPVWDEGNGRADDEWLARAGGHLDAIVAFLRLSDKPVALIRQPSETSQSRNQARDAAIVQLKKDKSDRTAGQIAKLAIAQNPDWRLMENGKSLDAGAVRAVLSRAKKAGLLP